MPGGGGGEGAVIRDDWKKKAAPRANNAPIAQVQVKPKKPGLLARLTQALRIG